MLAGFRGMKTFLGICLKGLLVVAPGIVIIHV
jgi:hypothetical protein